MSPTSHPKLEQATAPDTTGHSWDGIEELNNPLPRWWVWLWAGSFVFSLGYYFHYHVSGNGESKGLLDATTSGSASSLVRP